MDRDGNHLGCDWHRNVGSPVKEAANDLLTGSSAVLEWLEPHQPKYDGQTYYSNDGNADRMPSGACLFKFFLCGLDLRVRLSGFYQSLCGSFNQPKIACSISIHDKGDNQENYERGPSPSLPPPGCNESGDYARDTHQDDQISDYIYLRDDVENVRARSGSFSLRNAKMAAARTPCDSIKAKAKKICRNTSHLYIFKSSYIDLLRWARTL